MRPVQQPCTTSCRETACCGTVISLRKFLQELHLGDDVNAVDADGEGHTAHLVRWMYCGYESHVLNLD